MAQRLTPQRVCAWQNTLETLGVVLVAPRKGMNLFLYEKVGKREIVHEGSISEAGTEILLPHNHQKDGNPRGGIPLASAREQSSRGIDVAEDPTTGTQFILAPLYC